MREIRLSGSEGGGTGNSTGSPYPYPQPPDISVGAGHARDTGGGERKGARARAARRDDQRRRRNACVDRGLYIRSSTYDMMRSAEERGLIKADEVHVYLSEVSEVSEPCRN